MSPPARWTQMDSPVKPANDERGGRCVQDCSFARVL